MKEFENLVSRTSCRAKRSLSILSESRSPSVSFGHAAGRYCGIGANDDPNYAFVHTITTIRNRNYGQFDMKVLQETIESPAKATGIIVLMPIQYKRLVWNDKVKLWSGYQNGGTCCFSPSRILGWRYEHPSFLSFKTYRRISLWYGRNGAGGILGMVIPQVKKYPDIVLWRKFIIGRISELPVRGKFDYLYDKGGIIWYLA